MMPVIFFGGTVIFFFLVKKDVDSCTARIPELPLCAC